MARYSDGTLRKLIRYNFKIHPIGLNAALLHFHNCALLGEISSAEKSEFLPGMVPLVVLDWD